MTNRQIQICPACNRATEIVWVHSHGQCGFCKTNIDPCCSGGFQEKDAQLLVILSIVLNLIPQLNLLSVKICQSNWILDDRFCLLVKGCNKYLYRETYFKSTNLAFFACSQAISICSNGMVLIGNLDDRFCLNSMVFIGNQESPSQTLVFAQENKCVAGIQENHPLERAFQRKKRLARS